MDRAEFWASQCPARGAGLDHAHWSKCHPNTGHPDTGDTHRYEQCCHCMRAHDDAEVHDESVREDDVLVEPKCVTGNGPQGNPRGRGRGNLTEQDQKMLTFYVKEVRRDGYDNP